MKKILILLLIGFVSVSVITTVVTIQMSSRFEDFYEDEDEGEDDDHLIEPAANEEIVNSNDKDNIYYHPFKRWSEIASWI